MGYRVEAAYNLHQTDYYNVVCNNGSTINLNSLVIEVYVTLLKAGEMA